MERKVSLKNIKQKMRLKSSANTSQQEGLFKIKLPALCVVLFLRLFSFHNIVKTQVLQTENVDEVSHCPFGSPSEPEKPSLPAKVPSTKN